MGDREPGSTRDRILDAAEELFAERGFHATSLRAVTAEAGVNLAAVHYHFGSKEALLDRVLGRRLEPLNRRRLEALARAEADAGGRPSVEAIVHAFVDPAFAFLRDLGGAGTRFVRLAGRAHNETAPHVRAVFLHHFEEVARAFHRALCAALPEIPPREISWRMHFFVGAMAHVLSWTRHESRVPVLADDLAASDAPGFCRSLVAFCAAGLRAPVPSATGAGEVR